MAKRIIELESETKINGAVHCTATFHGIGPDGILGYETSGATEKEVIADCLHYFAHLLDGTLRPMTGFVPPSAELK